MANTNAVSRARRDLARIDRPAKKSRQRTAEPETTNGRMVYAPEPTPAATTPGYLYPCIFHTRTLRQEPAGEGDASSAGRGS